MKTRLALAFAVTALFTPCLLRADNETGFIEKFALASDREAVLSQLVPGTEDYYFFYALQYQNTRQAAKLTALLEQWAKRFPNSERRNVIENRAALLAYDADPQATLKFLRDRLNLQFNHEQQARDQKPDLPNQLDQERISRAAFEQASLEDRNNLGQVNDEALAALVREKAALSDAQRRDLLRRILRPDVPGLLDLIEADLKSRESRGFGEFGIHRALLPEQLDELGKRVPALYNDLRFVYSRVRKLAPNPDVDVEFDAAEREAYLDRLWAYAKNLSASYNTLKAQILLQRLYHDRARGIYDKARFQEYLKLPRRGNYVNVEFLRRAELASQAADLAADLREPLVGLPTYRDDEGLVRDYLLQLLKDEPKWEPWAAWLRDTWLKPIFAEAKITNGVGDPEKWASLLSPAEFQALKQRVDVDFAATNPALLAPADEVSIDLLLKNTPKLIVKIYEINTLSYFLTNRRQLNTDLALDGLVANREMTHDFTADEAGRSPFRRTARTFKFPELKGQRGAWIIEFIGGGKSSRALVRKGQWSLLQRTGPAGEMITVLDEARQPVKDAVVWLEGRKYTTDEKSGYILVPFTNQATPSKPIVLADAAGGFATLTTFLHHAEQYKLDAQFHIEREQLLARREATLAIRTALLLGDTQVSLGLIQEPKLTLTSTTLDGVSTTSEIKEVKLDPTKLFTHQFAVPERLASLQVTLAGTVENLSAGGTKQPVSASHQFHVNGIDRSSATNDGRFSRFGDGTVFELLGKNGEPIADTAIVFHFTHEDFRKPLIYSLSTDQRGRVDLGKLAGITQVQAETPFDRKAWTYSGHYRVGAHAIHMPAGEVIRVPWMGDGPLQPGDVSLLERRAETYVKDFTGSVGLAEGFLEIKALPPGDYSLFCRRNGQDWTDIHVVTGEVARGWLNGSVRQYEMRKAAPVHITSVKLDPDAVVVQVRNENPFVRVHVAATRFIPHGSLFESLSRFTSFDGATATAARRPNLYVAGRAIGDEYRYILDRRYSKLYPGNMLPRPGLLLNPWEVTSTDLAAQSMAQSENLARRAGDREARAEAARKMAQQKIYDPTGEKDGPNLDFLGESSVVLYNLVPDAKGIVRVDRKALGNHPYIQVYAEDLESSVLVSKAYPEMPMKLNDLRLVRNLDPQKPFAEKKEATVLTAGQTLTLADVLTADLETYDSLSGVFSLLTTLNTDENLAKFAWVIQWPKLSDEEKRAKYSEFACHELNFFLARKDAAFFQKVVQPYLRNKKDRTFMDDYLLGNDLRGYLEPWTFSRLNAAERCLLAQRLPGESAAMARHLREQWELLPPNPERENQLFETALRGRALTVGGKGELEVEKAKQEQLGKLSADLPALAPASPAPAPAAAALAAPAAGKPQMATSLAKALDSTRADETKATSRNMPAQQMIAGNRSGNVAISANAIDALLFPMEGEEVKRQRGVMRQFFRALGPTKEWAENNYYELRIQQQDADLISINAFWRDYAAWDGKTPFVSANVPESARNFPEMMLALAVLDLPFESPKHTTHAENGQYSLTAAGPVIAFHKEIKPAAVAPEQGALLVSQNFFRANDRYREEGNEKFDKYVTEEFLAGVVYGANIVVTNPTSARQKLSVLLQIPRGALPVSGTKATDSHRLQLEPYSTQTLEYFFYFPVPAAKPMPHYPVHVAREEQIVGEAKPFTFKVVQQLSQIDKTSWDYISQYGTEADVFAFLDKANIERLDLERVAWRARKSPEFFRKLVTVMEQRHVYSEPIYRYAVLHNIAAPLATWLRLHDDFIEQCGPYLESKLLKIDPIERRAYEHLEYSPLVNQRAHRVGAENRIPNPVLRGQYQHLLDILAHKPSLDAMDQMSVVYYLFLQDRVEEALARLHAIAPEALPTRLQYDYFRCYAAFYEEQLPVARGVVQQYADYPVDRWRKLFAEAGAQLDEIEGKQPARPGDKQPDREKQQGELAASEPSFDFKVENRQIALTWKNLREVTVRYYLMDPEFLFSASPFVTQDSGRFSIIKPTRADAQPLPEGKDQLTIPLPAEFTKANVLVEILGAGQRKAQTYHANTLKLQIAENYGRLEVRDATENKAVSKAYVKVYARLQNGAVRFFKDGYTDLRGRFDYASLNSSESPTPPVPLASGARGGEGMNYQMLSPAELGQVERFSILLMSESHGADVREAAPPAQ